MRPDLVGLQVVAISGKRQKLSVNAAAGPIPFIPDDKTFEGTFLNPGDVLTLIDPTPVPPNPDGSIPDWKTASGRQNLHVADASGRPGVVSAPITSFSLAPSSSSDPTVSEWAIVSPVNSVNAPLSHTRIVLSSNLSNCYDRATAIVNANVAPATAINR